MLSRDRLYSSSPSLLPMIYLESSSNLPMDNLCGRVSTYLEGKANPRSTFNRLLFGPMPSGVGYSSKYLTSCGSQELQLYTPNCHTLVEHDLRAFYSEHKDLYLTFREIHSQSFEILSLSTSVSLFETGIIALNPILAP